jgi:hypothetical protein
MQTPLYADACRVLRDHEDALVARSRIVQEAVARQLGWYSLPLPNATQGTDGYLLQS